MLKKTLITLTLPSLSLLAIAVAAFAAATAARAQLKQDTNQPAGRTLDERGPARRSLDEGGTGTLQKMIIENGSVTMDLDLNGFTERGSLVARPITLQFAVGANSFFPILVFNDLLRGVEPGSMSLVPVEAAVPAAGSSISQATAYSAEAAAKAGRLPPQLTASLNKLVVEKLPSGHGIDLAVRDSNTGFTFFNVEGGEYGYGAKAQSLSITGGRLLISQEFARALGLPLNTREVAGTISMGAAMQPIQIDQVVNGETKSMSMPPMQHALTPGTPTLVPGPDVIVGEVEDIAQFDPPVGTQVGLAIGTDSCNNGDQPVDWFALPQTDHPVVPQNLYRMSGGADNAERFEQIGQSWMKHTFLALEEGVCAVCNTNGCQTGSHLCPGCSDPYVSSLNGDQNSIGSRAWINPFTGNFPSNANEHSGHIHNGVSHRILVETNDLIPANNPGATYFGEAAYISPHEFTWCQSNPTQCNMFNNFSYRQFSVLGGPTNFSFPSAGNTVRMQPAIEAWAATGATVVEVEPDPGNDGKFFVAYKVTGPTEGVWHYEYAVFNMDLDRAIQSFTLFLGFPAPMDNIEFHAPPQHPGWPHDGTVGDAGYSNSPWNFDSGTGSVVTWSSDTMVQNPNANAIRWGTLYNFRFDSTAPPDGATARIGFFKTGAPVDVSVMAPLQPDFTPTPTPSPSPTSTVTPTATPTATIRPTPTPRPNPGPRVRPTPHPRA
jgi:hypothetical protein